MNLTHPSRSPLRTSPGEPLLVVNALRVGYGAVEAVKSVSLTVHRGEIVALIGANGAGKTTTLKSIVRLLSPSSGTLTFDGVDLQTLATEDVVAAGVSLVPEGRGIFPNLTVRENLDLGAWGHRCKRAMAETTADVVALFPRLGERMTQLAGTLSGGEQQMLAIGRALMARPAMLLLDEPSLGIAPLLVRQIFDAIASIATSGLTVLLVEQNTRMALATSARAYVLSTGEIRTSGRSEKLANDPDVQRAYLGG